MTEQFFASYSSAKPLLSGKRNKEGVNMELNRRDFLKGTIAVGSVAALGGAMAGCSKSGAETKGEESTEKSSVKPPDSLTDGKWVGKAMGHKDYLYAEVTIDDSKIADAKILRNDDTIGIGSVAGPMMAQRILESGNLDADTISGATMTSMAVRSAISDAITNAGGNPADFSLGTPEPAKGGTAQTADVDVVFMGAGTSGLVAATRLLENGYKVILLEKNDIPGGSMCMTYSGVLSAGSELQKNYSLGRFDDSIGMSLDARLEAVKKRVNPELNRFNGEIPYEAAMYENSGKMVDWMHDMGIGFFTMGVNPYYGTTPYLAPGCYMGGCGYAMQFLVDRINALGGQIVYGAKVTEFIKDNDGKIAGLLAECKDGGSWTVNARAVCLTSGGFAANQDMIKEHYPEYGEFSFNCAPGSTGDGIVLAQAENAAIECMGRDLGAFLSTTPQAGSRFEIAFAYRTTPGIMVNATGDQFGNVNGNNHAELSKAVRDSSNGGKFFIITDESGAVTTMKNDEWSTTEYKALFSRGDMVHFDTVQEAIDEYGIDNLQQTIDTHNAHAKAGEEDEFGRKDLPLINTHGGIWVCPCIPTFYLTTGGLAIDPSCHVLTEDREPIANLYAAGDVCGSIEEKDGRGYGYGFDAAMIYGYIMANTITADLA